MSELSDQQAVVRFILDRLCQQGLKWYRHQRDGTSEFLDNRLSKSFKKLEGHELHRIGRPSKGSLSPKHVLITEPHTKEKEAIVGFWLRWNFDAEPIEFRVFLGFWFEAESTLHFNGYRFEAPELGEDHNYYHCQPCRNFGDREILSEAALVSEKFPTIPINATNIVELTICALMSTLGRKKMNEFLKSLMKESGGTNSDMLTEAYLRCSALPS